MKVKLKDVHDKNWKDLNSNVSEIGVVIARVVPREEVVRMEDYKQQRYGR